MIYIKKLCCILSIFILISCNPTLDLSIIEPGESENKYNFLDKREENKYYIVDTVNGKSEIKVKENNKNATIYFLSTTKKIAHKINYSKIPIDNSWGMNILIYEKKINYLKITVLLNNNR